MPDFYQIQPDVAGGFGPETRMDKSVWPPRVDFLHSKISGWLGDSLLEFLGCFVATRTLANDLDEHKCTGYEIEECRVTSIRYQLPEFVRLSIVGVACHEDFGMQNGFLIVSAMALEVLKTHTIDQCDTASLPL